MSNVSKNGAVLFTGKADIYAQTRPGYPKSVIEYLKSIGLNNDKSVADVGSGTGKFSKLLLDTGAEIYCIEPNDDMRKNAEIELGVYPNFHSVNAEAEKTTLPDKSVDFVTAAQSFHWFDPILFKQECQRILKPNGIAILLWNNPDTLDDANFEKYVEEYTALETKYYPALNRSENKNKNKTTNAIDEFFETYDKKSFDNPFFFNKETFVKCNLSYSYAMQPDAPLYNEYIQKLEALFDKYQTNGKLLNPTVTDVFVGKV